MIMRINNGISKVVGELKSKKTSDPAASVEEAYASLLDFEKDYRHEHRLAWWLALVGPVIVTLVVLGAIYLVQGPKVAFGYVAAAVSAFLLFGRFIILIGAQGAEGADLDGGARGFLEHLNARSLFMMLTYLDVMVAVFVAFHMGIVFRLPVVGPKIAEMVTDGQFILRKQPWIRRAAFGGLVFFVIFPTSTTGSIGGSIFGRLLGMHRFRVVLAILTGSFLGNGLMLMFSKQLAKSGLGDNWGLRIGGVLAMVFALFLFERKFRRLKEFYVAQEKEEALLEKKDTPPITEPAQPTEQAKQLSAQEID